MSSAALISVVVTSYNQGRFLEDSLGSLVRQSHANWECFVIDDGSTDETEHIARQFEKKDTRFHYFSQSNAGVAAARNLGISKCNGDFIQFLDADDYLHPEKFITQLDLLHSNEKIDIVYGSSRYFFDGERDVLYPLHVNGGIPCDLTYKDQFQVEMLLKHNVCTNCAALFRKKVIALVSFRSGIYEDWLFNLECALNGFVFHFQSSFLSYAYIRMTESSQMMKHTYQLDKIKQFDLVQADLVKQYSYQVDQRLVPYRSREWPARIKQFLRQLTPPLVYDLAAGIKRALSN